MAKLLTPRFTELYTASNQYNARHDCAVIAVAVVTDSSYDDALAAMQLALPGYDVQKRPNPWPRGTTGRRCWEAIFEAINILGYAARDDDCYVGYTLRQFENARPNTDTFLFRTRAHAVGAKDGIIHDHSRAHGRRRIQKTWKIAPME